MQPLILDDCKELAPSNTMISFQLEDRQFRVPSYQFFKLNSMRSTSSSALPFCSLLKVLYPLSLPVKLSLSKGEEASVLTLASRWRILRVREMATIALERMDSLIPRENLPWKGSIHHVLGDRRIRRTCRSYNDHRRRGAPN